MEPWLRVRRDFPKYIPLPGYPIQWLASFLGRTSSILSTPAYGNDVELGIDTRSRDSGGSSVFITHTSRLLTTIPMHDNNSSPYSGADMERGTLKRVESARTQQWLLPRMATDGKGLHLRASSDFYYGWSCLFTRTLAPVFIHRSEIYEQKRETSTFTWLLQGNLIPGFRLRPDVVKLVLTDDPWTGLETLQFSSLFKQHFADGWHETVIHTFPGWALQKTRLSSTYGAILTL